MGQAMILRRMSAGGGIKSIVDNFVYTGTMLYRIQWMDGTPYHLFIFESSGTLTVTGSYTGDVWMCGGGGCGGESYRESVLSSGSSRGGGGGGGGYVVNVLNISMISGDVLIGASVLSSDGGATSYAGYTANGGLKAINANGGNGGCGGGGGGIETYYKATETYKYTSGANGVGAGVSTRPFLANDMLPQCGGGGGTRPTSNNSACLCGHGGSDGGDGIAVTTTAIAGNGGNYGGKRGICFDSSRDSSLDGGAGYGGGGGGAMCKESKVSLTQTGTSGAVMIRVKYL